MQVNMDKIGFKIKMQVNMEILQVNMEQAQVNVDI